MRDFRKLSSQFFQNDTSTHKTSPYIITITNKNKKFSGDLKVFIQKANGMDLNKIAKKNAYSLLQLHGIDLKNYEQKEIYQYIQTLIDEFHLDSKKHNPICSIDITKKILKACDAIIKDLKNNLVDIEEINWKLQLIMDDINHIEKTEQYGKVLTNKNILNNAQQEIKAASNESKCKDIYLPHTVKYVFVSKRDVFPNSFSIIEDNSKFEKICSDIKNKKEKKFIHEDSESNLPTILFDEKNNEKLKKLLQQFILVKTIIPYDIKKWDYLTINNIAWFVDSQTQYQLRENPGFNLLSANEKIEKLSNNHEGIYKQLINLRSEVKKNIENLKNKHKTNVNKITNLQKEYKENIQDAIKENYGELIAEETKKQAQQSELKINEKFKALERELDKKFKALERELDKKFKALERELDKKFGALERELDKKFKALERELDKKFGAFEIEQDEKVKKIVATVLQLAKENEALRENSRHNENKSIMRYFLLSPIGSSVIGYLTGKLSNDYRVGLGMGMFLFVILTVICLHSWKRNTINKEQDQERDDFRQKFNCKQF